MQNIVFANNIATTLAASLTSSQTTATLASSAGLPTLATGQIFPLTLNDAATQTIYEIVYVTAISGATLTIERGKEGTASRAWSVGDFAFSTNTAATTSDPYDVQGATYYTGADIGTANTYAVTLSPVPLALTPGMEVSIQNIVGTNTGASTLNVNATGALPIYYPGNVALGANSLIATYGATFRLNNGGTAWTLINSTGADVGPTPAANDSSNKRATTQYVETQIQSGSPVFAVAGGTSDALTATLPAGLTALQNGMKVRLQLAAANTTTTPTLNVTIGSTATGALTIVKGTNAALSAGDLAGAGAEAEFTYNQANNNWVLTNPATGVSLTIQSSVQGSVKNFKSAVPGVSSYTTLLTADEVVLENGSNVYITQRNVSLTVNANGTVGAPLSVTSARAASTWYYRWLWYNATNGLTATLDTSSTAPTAPTGYVSTDYKCRLPGASRTDSSANQYLLQILTAGKRSQYVVTASSNVAALPEMASGTAGSWTAVATGPFIPSTASEIYVQLNGIYINTSSYGAAAPNSAYSIANAPLLTINSSSSSTTVNQSGSMILESTNIYYLATTATNINCLGWEDNL